MTEAELSSNAKLVTEVKETALESNYLIEAVKKYTPEMLDLLYLCLSATRPQMPGSKYYDETGKTRFIPESIIKAALDKKRISKDSFRETCRALAGTVIDLNYRDGFGNRPAFQGIDYRHGEGLLYKWNPDVEPYVLKIEKNYSEVVCQYVYKTGRDKWAKRIIEQISQWSYKYKNGREYKYEELREIFGVEKKEFVGEKGKKNFALKLRRAAKNITENTPYEVHILTAKKDPIKTRIVTHYFIKWKKFAGEVIDVPAEEVASSDPAMDEAPTKPENQLADYEQDVIDRLVFYGLTEKMAVRFLQEKGLEYCQKNLEYVRQYCKNHDINNKGGLLRNALDRDYAGNDEARQKSKAIEKAVADENAKWNEPGAAWPGDEQKEESVRDEWERCRITYINKAVMRAIKAGTDLAEARAAADQFFREQVPEPQDK